MGFIPRYQMPNISSLLPSYTNSEQDFIFRTFHTGNYDYIKHLPEDIKFHQVCRNAGQRAGDFWWGPCGGDAMPHAQLPMACPHVLTEARH